MDKAQYRKLMDWMKNDCHLQNWWEGGIRQIGCRD